VNRTPLISLFLMLCIASCGGSDPVDKKAANTAGLPDIKASAPSSTGEPHVPTAAAGAAPAPAAAVKIPTALHGRWGLTPGDCMSHRGDAKGLLVISDHELRFYESRALPAGDVTTDGTSIAGTFTFTGEGQTWTKYEALSVAKGVLTRTESSPTASFNYARCS
jgi:hypothetical protein